MEQQVNHTYAKFAWEMDEELILHQGKAFDVINETAKALCS